VLFERLGEDVARLHSVGIMHGDLTTANIVIRNGELVFLDFGLAIHSFRTEDHAVDLRLIKETIVGAHSGLTRDAIRALSVGYEEVAGPRKARRVFRQLRAIERRGRYARVD
jgi:Kae1-associated kinase Bud32